MICLGLGWGGWSDGEDAAEAKDSRAVLWCFPVGMCEVGLISKRACCVGGASKQADQMGALQQEIALVFRVLENQGEL